ncbi:CopD family protein [Candidatus Nitrospira nitrificans]|uniref:Putative Copper transport protein, modulated with cytochrome c domain n=1 Tax=Candidatus Nitrospira nitrificans TaxID=1742973 RepID=A0A0S4LM99_9BACT|nr:CopD family protein [Candidatus Nitrospira nitrificans]CUS38629.1 putative Copper transport protein, modulated with cytochrome c domain [Candidatus Nitrospira nitrificans]
MIEAAGALFRCLQLASNMMLIGGCVFLAIAEQKSLESGHSWPARLKRTFPWLATLLLIGLVGLLATTTAQATGSPENAWSPQAWLDFLQKTRIGFIWALRAAGALAVLGVVLSIQLSPAAQWRYIVGAAAAALTLTFGSLASHSAAEEQALLATAIYALHLIAASVWFGGLPGVILVASTTTDSTDERSRIGDVLARFSGLAPATMIVIVISGVVVANRMFETNYAGLVATAYGWLLITKLTLLAVILSIASRAKSQWIPALRQSSEQAAVGGRKLRTWIPVEFGLAILLVIVATLLANAVPAKHDVIDNWPYPFRFSIDATWDDWLVRAIVLTGLVLLIIGGTTIMLGRKKQWATSWRIAVPTLLGIMGLSATLYPIAVQSYPETYRKTPVPFDAISIANGVELFTANCIPCHGPQAKGNGILAKTLPKQPVDLLTEPHTAMHTAGDFFHWLTYGRFNGVMPAFGEKFSEEERWDLLNFLHANSRGYQSRIITPRILPEQPFMATPNFSYTAHDGSSGTLKDFRGKQDLLLVLFSWPESRARLDQLRTASTTITATGAAILAVPMTDLSPDELTSIISQGMPFPVVTQGGREISRSYALFRRTLSIPDLFGEGTRPKHMEFLFDRFGYLRARWIPQGDGPGWTDISLLTQQISQLNQEREILPPPGDHVH